MKKFKRIMALVIAMAMVLGMTSMAAFAADNSNTLTINNKDANGTHSYEGYQVFSGNLDAVENKLSDIAWGEGVDGAGIITAIVAANADNDSPLKGKFDGITAGDSSDPENVIPASTAADVAKKIAELGDNSAELDAVARIISEHLVAGKKIAFTEGTGTDAKTYSATGLTDGYYFVKDTTTTLPDGDTASKFMLNIVKDVTINAKDTSLKPDKEITGGETNVKEGTAAIGDQVTFQVAIPVPDTTTYKDHFWFIMNDKLPAGMTFMGVDSIKVYSKDDVDTSAEQGYKVAAGATPLASLNANPASGNVGYTVTAKTGDETSFSPYTAPASNAAAVTAAGGQEIKVVFNEFKTFAETNIGTAQSPQNVIGEMIVVTYKAVVNDDAQYGATGNKNEVEFTYSNNPNNDYDGDEPDGENDPPTGKTPKDTTTTYLTQLEVLKVNGDAEADSNGKKPGLAGAEFEITSNDYNVTLVTGEKYVQKPYTAAEGETVETGDYWLLVDGTYTATPPTTPNINTTQYADTENAYAKVSYSKAVTTPGTTKKVTVISDKNGNINLAGLKPGTYTITETKAPDGYNKLTKTYTVIIDWQGVKDIEAKTEAERSADEKALLKAGGFSIKNPGSDADFTMDETGVKFSVTIENNSGTELPSTGGIGTTIFYVVGAILVIGAGVVLITRRRMDA